MGDVAAAAANVAGEGNEVVVYFVLSACGVVIAVLIAVVGFMVKARLDTRKLYEHNLEKRLGAGAEKMEKQTAALESLQRAFMDHFRRMLSKEDFEKYCALHKDKHDKVDKQIDDMKELSFELREKLSTMSQRLESGLKSMTDLLGKIVVGEKIDE